MVSRYSQVYFFQNMLLDVSFRNLNEIIHPNGENIPDYIYHYASAVFVNGSFWNDPSKILNEIQIEGGNHRDYINSYLDFVDMQRTTLT